MTDNPLAGYYTGTYYQQRAYSEDNRYPMAELLADILIARTGAKRVLDVGCAKGFLVSAFRDRGVEAYGFDVSAFATISARSPVVRFLAVCDAETDVYPYPDADFDLVAAIECMEHLTHPENAVAEIARVVKIGGYVAIASPKITPQRRLFQWLYPNPLLHPSEHTLRQWISLFANENMLYVGDFTTSATRQWRRRYTAALLRMALPLPPQVGVGRLLAKFGKTGNYSRAKLNNWFWQPEFMLFRSRGYPPNAHQTAQDAKIGALPPPCIQYPLTVDKDPLF